MEDRFQTFCELIQRNQLKEFRHETKKLSKEKLTSVLSYSDTKNLSQTLLHLLASHDNNEFIQWVLTLPVDSSVFNKQDSQGWTPLHCAAHSGNLKTCKILLEHPDCDPTITSNNKSTPLHYIGNYEKNSNLSKYASPNTGNRVQEDNKNVMNSWILKVSNLWTKYKALNSTASEVIDMMLAKGVDINALNSNMETPIQMACLRGNKETVLLFILKGAYVFGYNKKGLGCWDYAVNRNDTDIIELLNGFVQLFTDWLSEEILLEIFKHLLPEDLIKVSQVCKLFYRVCEDDFLWNRHLERRYHPGMSAKQFYFKEKEEKKRLYPCRIDWNLWENPSLVTRPPPPPPVTNNNNNTTVIRDYDFLFKILLIGDSGVGKSCLILRWADNTYTESFISTIGVDFKIRTHGFPDAVLKLQVWDPVRPRFGRGIQGSSYRGAHAILVMFDVTDRESFNNTKQWLQEVDRYACENVNKFLVGNKCDLVSRRLVLHEEAQEFADSLGIVYIEVSAKSSMNVNECFAMASSHVRHRLDQNKLKPVELPVARPKKEKGCTVS